MLPLHGIDGHPLFYESTDIYQESEQEPGTYLSMLPIITTGQTLPPDTFA